MAVPVAFGKKTEWKDGKNVETDEDNIINNVEPLWTKTPSTLKDEDYKKFYHTLIQCRTIHCSDSSERRFPIQSDGYSTSHVSRTALTCSVTKIQLYCNQVFVTDQVEGIVPEFPTLLHGVIDSPDIPLNVSRSYLQSDSNVKKISTYITKKVADRLSSIFKGEP